MADEKLVKAFRQACVDGGFKYGTAAYYACIARAYLDGKTSYSRNSEGFFKTVTGLFEHWRETGENPIFVKKQKAEKPKKPKKAEKKIVIEFPPEKPKPKPKYLDFVWGMEATYMDSHCAVWKGAVNG